MKPFVPLMLSVAGMFAAGCASNQLQKPPQPAAIVTPDNSLVGKVVLCNPAERFVVLNFPSGWMPGMDQTLFLYRAGLKVAEVKVTGPQNGGNIVADLTAGGARVGDEARDQ